MGCLESGNEVLVIVAMHLEFAFAVGEKTNW